MAPASSVILQTILSNVSGDTYGEVSIVPENIRGSDFKGNTVSSVNGANDVQKDIWDAQLNSRVQPTALEVMLNTSRKILSSTVRSLIDTTVSSWKSGKNNLTNHIIESHGKLSGYETNSNILNDTTESTSFTVSPLNHTTLYNRPTICVNGTMIPVGPAPTNLSEIPAKEIIIVVLMLSLWLYSIHATRRAWHRLLKE